MFDKDHLPAALGPALSSYFLLWVVHELNIGSASVAE